MALTMTDEQERARRKRLASPHVLMNGECFCSSCTAIAFKCELDATRAALAEAIKAHSDDVGRINAEWNAAAHKSNLALAATQAERDEAMAALATLYATHPHMHLDHTANDPWGIARASALLARPVGSVEALRGLLGQAVENGRALGGHTFGCQSTPELKAAWDEATAAIVARLLTPRADNQ